MTKSLGKLNILAHSGIAVWETRTPRHISHKQIGDSTPHKGPIGSDYRPHSMPTTTLTFYVGAQDVDTLPDHNVMRTST